MFGELTVMQIGGGSDDLSLGAARRGGGCFGCALLRRVRDCNVNVDVDVNVNVNVDVNVDVNVNVADEEAPHAGEHARRDDDAEGAAPLGSAESCERRSP